MRTLPLSGTVMLLSGRTRLACLLACVMVTFAPARPFCPTTLLSRQESSRTESEESESKTEILHARSARHGHKSHPARVLAFPETGRPDLRSPLAARQSSRTPLTSTPASVPLRC